MDTIQHSRHISPLSSPSQSTVVRERQKGEYHLEFHPDELARLAAQHEVFLEHMGVLCVAPINLHRPRLRILDSGTADGRWLHDLRESLPSYSHEYVGTDSVKKMFPRDSPNEISFHLQRADDAWPPSWQESFDYVHQRLVIPGCDYSPAATTIRRLCGLVKPGGWIELIEQDHNAPNPGGLAKSEELLRQIFTLSGTGYDYPKGLKSWLEEAGMCDIEEQIIDVPVGASNLNLKSAQKSIWQISSALEGFLPMARALPLTIAREELDDLPKHTARELARIGGHQRLYVVYGRRPV
ncbi:hypothetical protein BDV38DRAFT_283192 [Aspergillus pseudotamarii]|uniref:S-adenosyl-L-methionine-dependent methyltransferase n=1 Tax=Aspergillus pseudotamarii TaxID=132259 RepID=A0A5N6SRU8_ASPPS|nr:uncharacterized protein BDV38DRAFT_283192 [Aspergillus pseudotamarii]KAE8137352.1 hypothetical protein BDV38DRAFT_283192 [Aspergillus pseudotamarii]